MNERDGGWWDDVDEPDALEVKKVRRLVMIQSHVLPVVAVIAVFWARGW